MVNAPHLVALVRAGATLVNGKLIERADDQHQQEESSKRRETRRSTDLDSLARSVCGLVRTTTVLSRWNRAPMRNSADSSLSPGSVKMRCAHQGRATR